MFLAAKPILTLDAVARFAFEERPPVPVAIPPPPIMFLAAKPILTLDAVARFGFQEWPSPLPMPLLPMPLLATKPVRAWELALLLSANFVALVVPPGGTAWSLTARPRRRRRSPRSASLRPAASRLERADGVGVQHAAGWQLLLRLKCLDRLPGLRPHDPVLGNRWVRLRQAPLCPLDLRIRLRLLRLLPLCKNMMPTVPTFAE
jgi:hypothetical protein